MGRQDNGNANGRFVLGEYVDELLDGMRKSLPKALENADGKAVHQTRVATRRVRAAVELMRPLLTDGDCGAMRKVLKKVRKRLGPVRDFDVMLHQLRRLTPAKLAEARQWLIERLTEERSARQRDAAKRSASKVLGKLGKWWGVCEEMSAAADAVAFLLAQSVHEQMDAFAEKADRLAARDEGIRQDPHELRIAGKALRYTLEMAGTAGVQLPKEVTRAFKRMQDALGSWHDDVVLAEWMMSTSVRQRLAHHDARLQGQVLELAGKVLDRAERELEKFAQMWRAEGDGLSRTVRGAFALTRTVPGLAAPLDAEAVAEPVN
jgi:CHAD domain-containing protein